MSQPILLANIDRPNSRALSTYRSSGGYDGLRRAITRMRPEEVIEVVKKSGLRGRGGAGFPTGVKWGFVPKDSPRPRYFICNADESEPGTFKDRLLMERDPHLVLEGIIIGSYAVGARKAFLYIRGEFAGAYRAMNEAIAEAMDAGFLGKRIMESEYGLKIHMYRGAGAYICGEETGLMESIEGKRGHPRLKPPFPAVVGLFGCPTNINNVETLANVPLILRKGAEWYAGIGCERNTGPKLYCLSGHVRRPGVYEAPLGTRLHELIFERAGGLWRRGARLKAVIPGGSSTPVLRAKDSDIEMDFDSVAKAGSLLGSAGVIVMDDSTCMVGALLNILKFYAHESCGQCTPCREGCHWLVKIVHAIEHGQGNSSDIDLVDSVAGNIMGTTICPLGDAAAMPAQSFVRLFRDEFEMHVRRGGCPFERSH
ncbi:MAG: NADH-quinone oxidoreductase subunit NuoF [Acidobacteriota bacterium]